jgi:hypothetical protein
MQTIGILRGEAEEGPLETVCRSTPLTWIRCSEQSPPSADAKADGAALADDEESAHRATGPERRTVRSSVSIVGAQIDDKTGMAPG